MVKNFFNFPCEAFGLIFGRVEHSSVEKEEKVVLVPMVLLDELLLLLL